MADSLSTEDSNGAAKANQKIVVTYWSGRGLCEPLRCILAAADVKFENNFIQNRQDYLKMIEDGKLEYGQLPVVEMDGLNLIQSSATAYYLANRYDFMPSTNAEKYIVGHVWAACQDARRNFVKFPWTRDKDQLRQSIEHSHNGLMQRYCPKWEKQLATNGPFLLGSKATLGDLGIFEVLDFYCVILGQEELQTTIFDKFPNLATMYKSVLELGRLKTWVEEERPKLMTADWEVYANCVDETLSRNNPPPEKKAKTDDST